MKDKWGNWHAGPKESQKFILHKLCRINMFMRITTAADESRTGEHSREINFLSIIKLLPFIIELSKSHILNNAIQHFSQNYKDQN